MAEKGCAYLGYRSLGGVTVRRSSGASERFSTGVASVALLAKAGPRCGLRARRRPCSVTPFTSGDQHVCFPSITRRGKTIAPGPHPSMAVGKASCVRWPRDRQRGPRAEQRVERRVAAYLALVEAFAAERFDFSPRSDVERPAGVLGGGAFGGPSLLERLLRGLLSELLGFLRTLHVHPPGRLSSSALVGTTQSSAGLENQARGPAAAAQRVRATSIAQIPAGCSWRDRGVLVSFGVDKE